MILRLFGFDLGSRRNFINTDIINEKIFNFFNKNFFINNKNNDEEVKQSIFYSSHQPWNVSNSYDLEKIRVNCLNLKIIAQNSKSNSKLKKIMFFNKFMKYISICLFLLSMSILVLSIVLNINYVISFAFVVLFLITPFSLMLYFLINNYLKSLLNDLTYFLLATKNSWIYNPKINYNSYLNLRNLFPELFNRGDTNQSIDNELWGLTSVGNYFYSGSFTYDTEHTKYINGKRTRRTITYNKFFITIALSKSTQSRFHLFPENIASNTLNFFRKKEINVESLKFNEIFAFNYNGEKIEEEQSIVKVLSPAVQEKLIQLNSHKKNLEVLFLDNSITFYHDKNQFNISNVDINRLLKAEDKLILDFENQINELTSIGEEIAKYLD